MWGMQGINFHTYSYTKTLQFTHQTNFQNSLYSDKLNISNLKNFNPLASSIETGIIVGLLGGLLETTITSPLSIGFSQNNNQNINNQLLINLLFLLLILISSQKNNNLLPFGEASPFGGIPLGASPLDRTLPFVGTSPFVVPPFGGISPFGFPNYNLPPSYLNSEISTQQTQGTNRGGQNVVNLALQQLGKPYVFGASGPNAFDCSGLVQWVFKQCGKKLPRTADQQFQVGIPVSRNQLQPGDLVFFANTYTSGISHVGIYIGNGKFVHAANSRKGVIISSLSEEYYARHYAGAKRV